SHVGSRSRSASRGLRSSRRAELSARARIESRSTGFPAIGTSMGTGRGLTCWNRLEIGSRQHSRTPLLRVLKRCVIAKEENVTPRGGHWAVVIAEIGRLVLAPNPVENDVPKIIPLTHLVHHAFNGVEQPVTGKWDLSVPEFHGYNW